MNDRKETRCLDIQASEVRMETEADGRSVIRGVVIRYGSLSNPLRDSKNRKFVERFQPGAFSRSLSSGADVRLLVNHNRDLILGRTKPGTLELYDDGDALRFKGYPPDSAISDHYLKSLQRGDIDGTSFRFYKIRDSWSGHGDASIRDIYEADIDDVSIVVFPAYGDTSAWIDTEAATRSFEEHCQATSRPDRWLESASVRLRLAEAESPSELRYNKHHGPDGRFSSAGHFSKHGGTLVPHPGAKGERHAPGAIQTALDKLAGLRRDPTSHTDHDPGHVGEISTKLLKFDPHRFQYKLAAQGEHGVTDALHGVKKWDPNLGGLLQVWKDPSDHQAYVVNGHHRLDLAKKLGAEKVAVRFLHAKDAKEARGIGALTNIAEGRGNSVDAAKFFRDTGHTRAGLEAKGIPMRERVAHEGLALANLHKPIFDRVISGDLTPARGAIIGDGLNHAQQESVVKTLDKFPKSRTPSDATLRQTVLHARHAPVTKVKTHDLFGENEDDVSLAFHRGETSAHIMERLGREKRVFGTVAKERNAGDLERGGNVINTHESGKISREAAQNLDTFNLLQHRSGSVSKLLNEAAERIHKGEKKKAVHDDIYRRLPQAVHEALNGG